MAEASGLWFEWDKLLEADGMSWLALSLVTFALWGLWGIVAKLVSQSLGWRELFVVAGVSSAITTLVAYFLLKPNISMKEAGF